MSSLLSVAILFRHGARGPGDSETSAWEDSDEVVTQWQEHECENLSTAGVQQLKDLGKWFAKKYVLNGTCVGEPKTFFRGSKSDRAVESGRDFVSSFNETLGLQCCSEVPTAFEENADCYFRPWKVHTESGKIIKAKMKNAEWAAKVAEHREFLSRLRAELRMKDEYGENLAKTLWSVTHVAGLVECETYWPTPDRRALISRVKLEDYSTINQLACWVWHERFLSSGFEHLLGGWMFLDMVQRVFDPRFNLNMFSGHDYTILALLAVVPGLMPSLQRPIEFASHVIFELWDGSPDAQPPTVFDTLLSSVSTLVDTLQGSICSAAPASPSGKSSGLDSSCPSPAAEAGNGSALSKRILRVVLNQQPFERNNDKFGVDQPRDPSSSPLVDTVRDDRRVVLADLTMVQVQELVNTVIESLRETGLPAQFEMPTFV